MLSARRLLSACSILAAGAGAPACKQAPASQKADAAPPVAVPTVEVTEIEVPDTLRLTGSLRGFRETDLAANAAGRVLSTAVERGQQVTQGQVLAQLDVRAARLSATEASAQARSVAAQEQQAKNDCARYEKLHETGSISELEYSRMATQCQTLGMSSEAASARARLAAQNVGDGAIRAPFAGVITERYVEVGQFLRQDSRVVTIVSLDPLRLELAVPEAHLAKVKEGAAVVFQVGAYEDQRFTGKVRFVSGAVRSQTRDLVVEAIVENPDKLLKPGMFADVHLPIGTRKLPGVPRSALVTRDGKARAFVLVDGRLEERILALGADAGDRVAVTKGVVKGDKIASGELGALTNGMAVK